MNKGEDEKLDEALRYRDSYGAPGGPDGKKCWEYYGDPRYLTLEERKEIRQRYPDRSSLGNR